MPAPPPHIAEALTEAGRYRLTVPRSPLGGRVGELMGAGAGSSVEFQDFRAYVPGDDPRHINWAAFARTDRLTVRLFREEVRPMADIFVDASASMGLAYGGEEMAAKERCARQLACLLAHLARCAQADPLLWAGPEGRKPPPAPAEPLAGAPFADKQPTGALMALAAGGFRRRSLRYVISDFLFPHDPDALVRRLADGAAALALIQVVAPEEESPGTLGPVRMVDAESEETVELVAGSRAVEGYLSRFRGLRMALARAARRAHAAFAVVRADRGIADVCRSVLCREGILEAG